MPRLKPGIVYGGLGINPLNAGKTNITDQLNHDPFANHAVAVKPRRRRPSAMLFLCKEELFDAPEARRYTFVAGPESADLYCGL